MTETLESVHAWLRDAPANVITEVAPEDTMHARGPRGYEKAGQLALWKIKLAMVTAGKPRLDSILDFGCGYGRILRTVKAAFPQASLTACDINRDAVDFCARVLGATPAYSSTDPSEISIDERFDLIWCNSLFTHLDLAGWDRFLPYLESLIAEDGIFIFTTGGRRNIDRLRDEPSRWGLKWMLREDIRAGFLADYERDGFAHRDSIAHRDSMAPGWGYTAAAPSWVCRRLEEITDLRLLSVAEGDIVDTFTCMRDGSRRSGSRGS